MSSPDRTDDSWRARHHCGNQQEVVRCSQEINFHARDRDRDNVWLLHGGGFGATPPHPRNVLFSIDEGLRLFPKAICGVTGTGRDMFKLATLSIACGCDLVRVGFEDGVHLPDGTIAQDNSDLVRAAVDIAKLYGAVPATLDEARERFRI